MIYEEKNDKIVRFYNVTFDEERLKEILKKLKQYSYISIEEGQMAGNITRWPATNKNIKKRVSVFFYTSKNHSTHTLLPETIVHHTENNCDYVTYKYLFEKLPDLYHYIDIILNNKDIMNYTNLFECTTGKIDMFYAIANREQLIIEGILNYKNSPELTNYNKKNKSRTSNEKYDYKSLEKLYQETLACFNFSLIAIKEYLDDQKIVNGLSLQRKKK